jgi:sugar phosphate isomerase/epimerase
MSTSIRQMIPAGRERITRREFVRKAALASAVAGSLASLRPSAAAQRNSWLVSCRDIHLKTTRAADCWSAVKALGADGVEVGVGLDLACPALFHSSRKYSLANEEGIRALKQDMEAAGCRITAFMMANRLEDRLEEELRWTRGLVKAATQLGVTAIRIDVVPSKLTKDEFLPVAIHACRRLCEVAEGAAVRFGIENHGHVTNDPEFLEKLFAGVGSSTLGLTLDCANFYWFGHPLKDLYAIFERFSSRVVHTHCKSIAYPEDRKNVRRPIGWEYDKYNCPLYEGDIDFKRVAGILRKASYQGDLCLEDESLGRFPESEREGIVRRELGMLRELARGA